MARQNEMILRQQAELEMQRGELFRVSRIENSLLDTNFYNFFHPHTLFS